MYANRRTKRWDRPGGKPRIPTPADDHTYETSDLGMRLLTNLVHRVACTMAYKYMEVKIFENYSFSLNLPYGYTTCNLQRAKLNSYRREVAMRIEIHVLSIQSPQQEKYFANCNIGCLATTLIVDNIMGGGNGVAMETDNKLVANICCT